MKTEISKFVILFGLFLCIGISSSFISVYQIGNKNKEALMPSELIYGCQGEQIKVSPTSLALSGKDVGVYVLHSDSLFNDNIISISKSGVFDDPQIYCTKLYVSYLYGPDKGDSTPDLNSNSLKIVFSASVIWLRSVSIETSVDCNAWTGDVEISFILNGGCDDITTYSISGSIKMEEAKLDSLYTFKIKAKDDDLIPYYIEVVDKVGCKSSIYDGVACVRLAKIPDFPFPPPKASAFHVLSKSLFTNSEQLSDIDSILSSALDCSGYSEKSYYQVPNGFTIITRIEQIDKYAVSLNSEERWQTPNTLEEWEFKLSNYLQTLLNARQGKYRMFVFIITDTHFGQNDTISFKLKEAEKVPFMGLNVLPEEIAKIRVSEQHRCTALIYEFDKRAQSPGVFVATSNYLGKDHLTKNNFLNCLDEIQPTTSLKSTYILLVILAIGIPFLIFLLKNKKDSKMKHKRHIHLLISKNKLKAALVSFMEGVKFSQQQDLENNLVQLSGRLNYILDEKQKGMIRDDNFNIEQNKIRSALSNYLEEYNESPNFQFNTDSEIQNTILKKPENKSVSQINQDADDLGIAEIKKQNLKAAHFKVAVSFPGEKRDYVEETVNELAKIIGSKNIFYDKWYNAQLAGPDLDLKLQDIYKDKSDLVLLFFSKEYDSKTWCGIEWRAIRTIINQKQDKVMFLTFDFNEVSGTFNAVDGFINLEDHNPFELAKLVEEKLFFM